MSRLSIKKKFSLAGFAEGWDECYVLYTPATRQDMLELQDKKPESLDRQALEALTFEFIKNHVKGGKVLVSGTDGDTLEDLQPEDIEDLGTGTVEQLAEAITGVKLSDPKVSAKARAFAAQLAESEATTETS